MFPKAPVQIEKAVVKIKGGGSNRITIRKIFDVERKELTESNCQFDKLSPVNIL